MKISFVLDTFGGGGKERRCLQLIQGLNKQGYYDIQVIIINDDAAYSEIYDTSAQIHIIDRKNKELSLFETCKYVKKLFKSFNPDIVQTWGGISTLIPVLLKPFFKYKLIGAYVADADSPKILSLDGLYPWYCDKIVGNSKVGLEAYRIPHSKRILIYNGFNEKRLECKIEKEGVKKSLGIDTDYVVAMIATFWSNKDWGCYLQAAKSIVKKRNDITFLAIGGGPTWEAHNAMVEDDERSRIKMLGRRSDVDELIQICNVTVLVSLHGEGISNSILESMAWGVPVIATNSGGTPEIISDGETGLLLDENRVELLEIKLLSLLDNKELLKSMSIKATAKVKSDFMLSVMTQRYINLYESFYS